MVFRPFTFKVIVDLLSCHFIFYLLFVLSVFHFSVFLSCLPLCYLKFLEFHFDLSIVVFFLTDVKSFHFLHRTLFVDSLKQSLYYTLLGEQVSFRGYIPSRSTPGKEPIFGSHFLFLFSLPLPPHALRRAPSLNPNSFCKQSLKPTTSSVFCPLYKIASICWDFSVSS